jgi:hypothetical protein
MTVKTVTLQLPESLYVRLQQTALATKQSFDDIVLRVLQVGSPPNWERASAEFQTDLAALDRLDDAALWRIARTRQTEVGLQHYQELLDKNANDVITTAERHELAQLRAEYDRHMLLKVHAASLLQWRGHQIPPAE